MKILLVEDDSLIRVTLEAELQARGFTVVSTPDPMDAVKKGMELKPDLLICDWLLENPIDGVGVAHAIQSVHPEVLLLLITGAWVSELQNIAEEVRPAHILRKPFEPAELVNTVDTIFLNEAHRLATLKSSVV